MYELFSDDLQDLLFKVSKNIAKDMNSVAVFPAHFLLGIIEKKIGLSYFVINYIVDNKISDLEDDIKSTIPLSKSMASMQAIEFSPSSNTCIKKAKEIMQDMNKVQITVEHLLLAITQNIKNTDLQPILEKYNLTNDEIYDILKRFGDNHLAKIKRKPGSDIATPILDRFCKDLTELAWDNKLDPIIGRKSEMKRVMQILSRRYKNNPILLGYPGVGKTAIIEGLSQLIVSGQVPKGLENKRLLQMEMGTIVAGTKYRGEFEDRMNKILKEVEKAKNCILFIDEIHTIVGAGGAEGAIDASNMLKPFLARGKVQVIGSTTFDEYKKHIEKDQALERRFQPLIIDEPNDEETLEILEGIKLKYENFHNIRYTDDSIKKIVEYGRRYINDRYLPDKAIDILDECGAFINVKNNMPPKRLNDITGKMEVLSYEKKEAFENKEFSRLPEIQNDLTKLYNQYLDSKNKWIFNNNLTNRTVDEFVVAEVVSSMTGIQLEKLNKSESERLINITDSLKTVVIGQDEAIDVVSRAIKRGRLGIKKIRKPVGSFIFCGPTGVGKTEMARRLAEFVFGSEDSLIRIDMSDFMERHNVSRLVGAPPGYVGYDEGGELTEKVRRKPYSIILFDEIEKAHPEFFNIMLQILEEGQLVDNLGHKVDFSNCVIIMTSNIGAKDILHYQSPGFAISQNEEEKFKDVKNRVNFQLKKRFNPEFLNRIDDIIIFRQLLKKHLLKIIDIMIEEVQINLNQFDITMKLTKKAKEYIIDKGYDEVYGARPLRRVIQRDIEDIVSDMILEGKIKEGDNIKVNKAKNGLSIKKENNNNKTNKVSNEETVFQN